MLEMPAKCVPNISGRLTGGDEIQLLMAIMIVERAFWELSRNVLWAASVAPSARTSVPSTYFQSPLDNKYHS